MPRRPSSSVSPRPAQRGRRTRGGGPHRSRRGVDGRGDRDAEQSRDCARSRSSIARVSPSGRATSRPQTAAGRGARGDAGSTMTTCASRASADQLARAVLRRASDPHAAMTALDRSVIFEKAGKASSSPTHSCSAPARIASRDASRRRATTIAPHCRRSTGNARTSARLRRVPRRRGAGHRRERRAPPRAGEIAEAFAVADRAHALAARDYRPRACPTASPSSNTRCFRARWRSSA